MLTALSLVSLVLSALPALLFLKNLREYLPPHLSKTTGTEPSISILIPARNEELSIANSINAAKANTGVDLEIVVLDDHSQDSTAAIVRELAVSDPRIRLHDAPELLAGWCGKQHACNALAGLASNPLLVFIDADVRLAPNALSRMATFLEESKADLASGFPRQETVGLLEQMVIPLMHFILLGFLPLRQMRLQNRPSMGAGCGQLFITRATSYQQMGGHATIRSTLHDGLKLPRAFRASGLKTDLFDATDVATCRMYRSAGEVWSGLAKNATEALAAPGMIVPATILLFGGQVLPILLLMCSSCLKMSTLQTTIVLAATFFAYLPRLVGAFRFKQSFLGAILHPAGVLMLLAIQWYALGRELLGKPATWKGRPYPARGA